jgi:hypothetical protein
MLRPSHSSRFYHPISNEWGVQIIKLLIMWISPLLCHLVTTVTRRNKFGVIFHFLRLLKLGCVSPRNLNFQGYEFWSIDLIKFRILFLTWSKIEILATFLPNHEMKSWRTFAMFWEIGGKCYIMKPRNVLCIETQTEDSHVSIIRGSIWTNMFTETCIERSDGNWCCLHSCGCAANLYWRPQMNLESFE